MDTFTFKHYQEVDMDDQANNFRVEFGTGNEQIQRKTVNGILKWTLPFRGDKTDFDELYAFWNSHKHGEQFYWIDPVTGTQHVCTFSNDNFQVKEKYGHDETGYGMKAFDSVELILRKVWGVA
jgi:phage-related protein